MLLTAIKEKTLKKQHIRKRHLNLDCILTK